MAPATEQGTEQGPDRLGIGQLLVRLLSTFREEMLAVAAAGGHDQIRPPHVHVLANMRKEGVRLTELAARCQLSLATASEMVTELQGLGYLDRRADPADGRAKLIVFTPAGRRLFAEAGKGVARIEGHWAALVGDRRFEQVCTTLQELLDQLGPDASAR